MKHQTLGAMSLLLAAAAFNGVAPSARAQDATATTPAMTPAAPMADSDDAPWRFGVTVPLWAPQINGNATLRGHQENVDVSFNTLRQHLDASFSLGLNAQKGKLGLFSSVGYMKFSGSSANASFGLKFLIVNGGASYLLVKTDGDHPFVLAGTAGVRYWYAATTIGLSSAIVPPSGFSGGQQYNLVDPVVGLRASQFITQKLHFDVAGDIGGFNINHNTDMTWSASGMATYDFAKWFSLSAGYSALGLDESEGSGNSKNGINFTFHGVAVNATFKF